MRPRRVLNSLAASGLLVAVSAATPGLASADTPQGPGGITTKPNTYADCYYKGARYREGSFEVMNNAYYRCAGSKWVYSHGPA